MKKISFDPIKFFFLVFLLLLAAANIGGLGYLSYLFNQVVNYTPPVMLASSVNLIQPFDITLYKTVNSDRANRTLYYQGEPAQSFSYKEVF